MLLSYAWLKAYLPKLPPPDKLAETMLLHGLDVESVRTAGPQFEQVVVGEIVGIKAHPNADKLQLADVVIAPEGKPQEIVCGAPNIAVGQKVPVALIGAKLPNGMTIESRAIRGVTSNGMICAEDELGLGKNHAGILVLDPSAKVGTPLAEVLGGADVVFDVTTPANRADLMSMRGLAWEIGAMLGQSPKFVAVKLDESKTPSLTSVTVHSDNIKQCPLFTARVVRGVTQVPTPLQIVERLQASGMRSISAIVDITNYVMLEYGQPLHAYDAAAVAEGSLTARQAKPGEQLITLDRQTRTLTPDMLVIADAKGPVGLAGVMGGRGTVVTTTTTDIILEAAIFDPVSIRKTSRRLGLVSEASKRFEKGLWPEVTLAALNAAAAMIADICDGTIEQGIVKTGKTVGTKRTVKLPPAYISERLGIKIPVTKSKAVLQRLGFGVTGTAKQWTVTIPAWRPDVSLPEDIVDEIGRMVGYEKVPKSMPSTVAVTNDLPPALRFREEVKNILVDMGGSEVISHAFYGEAIAKGISGQHFEVANPLDENQHRLRKSLFPQIADVLKQEADAGQDAFVFEIGYVFDPERPGEVDRQQSWKVAIGVTHKGETQIETIQQEFQNKLGTKIKPNVISLNPVRNRKIEYSDFDLKDLMTASKKEFGNWDPERHMAHNVKYQELSKFPAITRDISFWWPGQPDGIDAAVNGLRLPLLKEYRLNDTFTKDSKTSYAFTFIYQSADRTLTKAEVDKLEQIIKAALVKHGATIR